MEYTPLICFCAILTKHMTFRQQITNMWYTFRFLFRKKRSIFALALLSFFFFTLLKLIPVYHILRDSFRVPGMPLLRKAQLFYSYTYATCADHLWNSRLVTILLSILIALNIFLFVAYAKRQGKFILATHKTFLASIGGIILGFFGIGCISCGAFILAPLITFLGLGAYMQFFQSNAYLISVIGLVFVLFSNFYLLYQLSKPITCNVSE